MKDEELRKRIEKLDAACRNEPDYVKRMPLIAQLDYALMRYRKMKNIHEYESILENGKVIK